MANKERKRMELQPDVSVAKGGKTKTFFGPGLSMIIFLSMKNVYDYKSKCFGLKFKVGDICKNYFLSLP